MIKALAAKDPTSALTPFEYNPGALKSDQIDIKVEYCGICHSDLSMKQNEWGMTAYPFVPGHEVIGTVAAVGDEVRHIRKGDRVGLGWFSGSCLTCRQCLSGNHNLCATNEMTMIGRHGGFASHVRTQALWATPLPQEINATSAGPLFCGGVTVFNPLVQCDIRPWHKVGVIGIGGLGHLALQFSNAWGCEVTAFSSSGSKADEARKLGAHKVVDSRSGKDMKDIAGSLDFILSTANADLNWQQLLGCLAPKGRLHFVGAVPSPVAVQVFPMITNQSAISASPLGSPSTTRTMLDFCARHEIAPVIETFPMSQANEALAHLAAGKARFRVVLECDL